MGSSIRKSWVKRSIVVDDNPVSTPAAAVDQLNELFTHEKLSPVVAKILLQRCHNDLDLCRRFLNPRLKDLRAPELLPDLIKGVDRLEQALAKGEGIVVHGDYDVDGISSIALLVQALESMGAKVFPFVPERDLDGYGLSRRGIEFCKEKGAVVLLTCDCGITAIDEVALANEQGIDVVITDHHLPGESLPQAFAVINPNRRDSLFPFRSLCGAGVAFYFLIALRARLRERGYFTTRQIAEPDLRRYLDLVALATLADSMPLIEENRIFVSRGLEELKHTASVGLRALLDICGLSEKNFSTWDVVFKLVPRLNVGGRMNKAQLPYALLLEKDATKARSLAAELEELNVQRRSIEEQIRQQAMSQIDQEIAAQPDLPAIIIAGENWPKGVLGIVAARLLEHYHKTAVVIGFDASGGVGSARGMPGVNLLKVMQECHDVLQRFGGHEAAAGLSIEADKISVFKEKFLAAMRQGVLKSSAPQLEFDEVLDLSQLDRTLLEGLSRLGPFGRGNPEPLFTSEKVEVCEARFVGDGAKHLKLRFRQGKSFCEAIGFSLGPHLGGVLPSSGSNVDIVFHMRWNDFRGERTIQLEVKDLR